MNYICMVLYAIGLLFIVRGLYRGMVKMIITIAGILITLFLVYSLAPQWQIALNENVFIYECIESTVAASTLALPLEAQELVLQSEALIGFIMKILAYISMYTMIAMVVKIVIWLILKMVQLPGIHFLNAVAGGVLGAIQGVMVLWLLFLIITICYGYDWGFICYKAIRHDAYMSFLYDHNLILKLLFLV